MQKKYFAYIFIILIAFCSNRATAQTCPHPKNSLRIAFLNVGQGDATLITCPDGKTQTLIDSGDHNEKYPGAEELFLNSLKSVFRDDLIIETAINTHPHSDHLYGFLNILRNKSIEIRKYYDNGASDPEHEFEEEIRSIIKKRNIYYTDVTKQKLKEITICPETKLKFIPTPKLPSDLNNYSLVSKLEYGGIKILLLADVYFPWEEAMIATGRTNELRADIVKLGHHGLESSGSKFLDIINPKIAVLSVGKEKLKDVNISLNDKLYVTARDGTITVTIYRGSICVSTL